MHGKQSERGVSAALTTGVSAQPLKAQNVEPLINGDHNALEIIESMEQGVIVWSPDGHCSMFNERIFDVLELV